MFECSPVIGTEAEQLIIAVGISMHRGEAAKLRDACSRVITADTASVVALLVWIAAAIEMADGGPAISMTIHNSSGDEVCE